MIILKLETCPKILFPTVLYFSLGQRLMATQIFRCINDNDESFFCHVFSLPKSGDHVGDCVESVRNTL